MPQLRYIDLAFKSLEDVTNVEAIITSQKHSLLYLNYFDKTIEKNVIKFCGADQSFTRNKIHYEFIKSKSKKFTLHISLFRKLRRYKPDAILIHSFRFELQIILLRFFVGFGTKIMVLNHAEQPYRFPKSLIQILTEKFIDIYFLTSFEQAVNWTNKRVFPSNKKFREMMEGSTFFSYKDKSISKNIIQEERTTIFFWCGSLNSNKDPLTILDAFAAYHTIHKDSRLYMAYNSVDLLDEVNLNIIKNRLADAVILLGNVVHVELEKYYQAADYFILGSHREGSGFSLCEAMACGCIPIVTNIPSFRKMTDEGDCGFLFSPENKNDLYSILINLHKYDKSILTKKVLQKFDQDLSFKSIATTIEKEIIGK